MFHFKIIILIHYTSPQVHPGYGFLSENAAFSAALEERGVAFMGPGPRAIREMGDKIGSKKLAQSAGVSVIPGFLGEVEKDEDVLRVAHEIGYPGSFSRCRFFPCLPS